MFNKSNQHTVFDIDAKSGQNLFYIITKLIEMSPMHKKIARYLYLCYLALKKGKMKDFKFSIAYLAKKIGCNESTVKRFFRKYKTFVERTFRNHETNIYTPRQAFLWGMKYLDDFGLIGASKRQQKAHLFKLLKTQLPSSTDHVQICPPLCPNLPPNPKSSYPEFISTGGSTSKQVLGIKMTENQAACLAGYPEAARFYAQQDYEWYKKHQKIYSPYHFIKKQMDRHMGKEPWKNGIVRRSF